LQKHEGGYAISAYKGELTKEVYARSVAKIKAAFPQLPNEFYAVLGERIKAKGFSDERLSDAVNNVIDNCQYPTPTLAQFLSFDKKIKLHTYDEVVKTVQPRMTISDLFSKVKVKGQLFWVRHSDKKRYNLPDEF
jgi:hypothetical protein